MANQEFKSMLETSLDLIARKYSYLTIKKKEFEEAKKIIDEESGRAESEQDFVSLVKKSFSRLNDGHLNLWDKEGKFIKICNYDLPRDLIIHNRKITQSYLLNVQAKGPITLGRIENISYLSIDQLRDNSSFKWLYDHFPLDKDKFIIDFRANCGGNSSLGEPLVLNLLGKEGPFISYYLRYRESEENPDQLSDFKPCYINGEFSHDRKKVIVLTSQFTCSSAEMITMDLKAIPGAILIGDKTCGSSANPQIYLLEGPEKGEKIKPDEKPKEHNSRFALSIPSWLNYQADKTLLECHGIEPHIFIEPKESIIGNRDLVLEKAIEIYRN